MPESRPSRRPAQASSAARPKTLVEVSRSLDRATSELVFAPPTAFVYRPLAYARAPHELYLERYGRQRGRVLLVGMNPGPFGMAQTGIPFGDVSMVRDFLGIEAKVTKPDTEHPLRPVLGFACPRSEVSGTRLWGWARQRFGTAEAFFERFFVMNYCPLAFLEAGGKNRTPDKLARSEQTALFGACDRALLGVVQQIEPRLVVGIGGFAETAARRALSTLGLPIGTILHPSPANPKANSGWAEIIENQLAKLGV
jgi:single-strand selective monofunctional uracil DNA glycosylase